MYHNTRTKNFEYRSFNNAKKTAEWVNKFLPREEKDEQVAFEQEQLLKNFARQLALIMRKNRTTQKALADYLGYGQQTVSKWLTKQYMPARETVERIANFYEVDFSFFTEGRSYEKRISSLSDLSKRSRKTNTVSSIRREVGNARTDDIPTLCTREWYEQKRKNH